MSNPGAPLSLPDGEKLARERTRETVLLIVHTVASRCRGTRKADMTVQERILGKFRAARTLWRMCRHLTNWAAVWQAYRAGKRSPPLRFRRGLTLSSGALDDPLLMLQEIYGEKIYLRHLKSRPEGVVLDVGANIGAVALDFARRWPNLTIHSYEPNPETFQMLKRNISENHASDRVVLFNEAVAAQLGSFALWTGFISVGASGYLDQPPPGAKRISVPCVDLAAVFQRVSGRTVFLLKIDAEGAEVDILQQAANVPFGNVRNVAVECHEQLRPGALQACKDILHQLQFSYKAHAVVEEAGVHMLYGWRNMA